MNEIKIFNYNDHQVRTIEQNGETWWVLKDVCMVLGLSDARRVAERLDEDELSGVKLQSGGQTREMYAVNESGLYNVILRSDKPKAKDFKRWVTHEVLPSIRKTGGYLGNENLFVDAYFSNVDEHTKTFLKITLAEKKKVDEQLAEARIQNEFKEKEIKLLTGNALQWDGRSVINAMIKAYASQFYTFDDKKYARAWTDFKKELLYKHSINLNARKTNFLNNGGKKSELSVLGLLNDDEIENALSTVTALCINNNVQIGELLAKCA